MSAGHSYAFFLGGRDLEMAAIRELLAEADAGPVHDRGLSWGARASAYREQIEDTLARGRIPVLIELEPDLDLGVAGRAVWIDHHGGPEEASRPTSLEQVFRLLGLPAERWDRRLELVAANDRGGVDGLIEAGATAAEIRRLRAEDRAAQGITVAEEEQAAAAARRTETALGGRLTVARLPHARTAALTDRLHVTLGGPGYENLLVLSPREVNFFGRGDLAAALDRAFPGGWLGGALPAHGFWGHAGAAEGAVRRFLEGLLVGDRAPLSAAGVRG